MDIVDTFNHLIPTEHLDDALFLGSNLENEVCEDFSTSQNVLEDSLKNMLSDKDPMLGSASAQFYLPVLDSNDPNFQMPCSTVVGLDDIMDEGAKGSSHSMIDEDDLSSNRKLRDQMDDTTLKSPRKSPRLMTQEPVRSLRQSTLDKRSNAPPPTKKSAVKSGSAQKGGLKQQDREQSSQEDGIAKGHSKDVEHNSTETYKQKEATPPASADSEQFKCFEDSSEMKTDTQQDSSQNKTGGASHRDVSVSHLSETSSPVKETEVKNEGEAVVNEFSSEISSEKKIDYKTVKELSETKRDEKRKETGMVHIPSVARVDSNASEIQENLTINSDIVKEKLKFTSGLQTSADIVSKISLPIEEKQESFEDAKMADMKNDPPSDSGKKLKDSDSSMEPDQISSNIIDIMPAESENKSSEGGIVQDIPAAVIHHEADIVKTEDHEKDGLQEDGNSGLSSKRVKNVKTKHTKSKQNKNPATQQKLALEDQQVAAKRKVLPGNHRRSSVNLKHHTEEKGDRQHIHKPVKAKKKTIDKEVKTRSHDSVAMVKKQPFHPQAQSPSHVRKTSTEQIVDKSSGHHTGSKGASHVTSGLVHHRQGQLPHQNQKLFQKLQLPKTNNCVKEEGGKKESMGVSVDSLKEDEKEKLKLRKLEKNLQPRQRRSSKSFSFDDPPLFIPDNISSVKKESSEHWSPNESKSRWVPSKHCGFCQKPHGNSCTSSNPALQRALYTWTTYYEADNSQNF